MFIRFFLLFLPSVVFASFVGNTDSPAYLQEGIFISDDSPVNIRAGGSFYVLWDKNLQFEQKYREESYKNLKIPGEGVFALLGINIKERVTLYTNIGGLQLKPKFEYQNDTYSLTSKRDPYYEGGAKAVLLEFGDTSFGVDAKYNYFHGKGKTAEKNSILLQGSPTFTLHEWQLSCGLTQKMHFFYPYLGITYQNADLRIKNVESLPDNVLKMHRRHKAGVFLGLSLSTGSKFALSGEIRLINETSAYINGELRF